MTHATTTHDTWRDPADCDRIAEVVAFIRNHDTAIGRKRSHALRLGWRQLARAHSRSSATSGVWSR
jgi:hypothetical protein